MVKKIVYLSYTGLMEPLGYSQIYSYISKIKNYEITLITVEKKANIDDKDKLIKHRNMMMESGIAWKYFKYSNNLRVLNSLIAILKMSVAVLASGNCQVVHARSYVAAVAALIIKKIIGSKIIFDMRALWVDELVDSNSLDKKSFLAKILYHIEYKLLNDSDKIISLTNVAVEYLVDKYKIDPEKFIVIPTCVDESRFQCSQMINGEKKMSICSLGGIMTGWYNLELFEMVVQKILKRGFSIDIITNDNHELIKSKLRIYSENQNLINIYSKNTEDVPDAVKNHRYGVLFFKESVGKLGSSPTRLAEYQALGLPVIANDNVGDMGVLLNKYNSGIIFKSVDDVVQNFDSKFDEMEIHYEEYSRNAIKLVADKFSLNQALESYRRIYNELLLSN